MCACTPLAEKIQQKPMMPTRQILAKADTYIWDITECRLVRTFQAARLDRTWLSARPIQCLLSHVYGTSQLGSRSLRCLLQWWCEPIISFGCTHQTFLFADGTHFVRARPQFGCHQSRGCVECDLFPLLLSRLANPPLDKVLGHSPNASTHCGNTSPTEKYAVRHACLGCPITKWETGAYFRILHSSSEFQLPFFRRGWIRALSCVTSLRQKWFT